MVIFGGFNMNINRKLMVVMLILLILNITPASASALSEIQKDGDYVDKYTHESGWYKFCNLFEFYKTIFHIVSLMALAKSEMEDSSKKADEQRLEMEKGDKLKNNIENLNILSKYHDEKSDQTIKSDRNKTSKTNKTNNTCKETYNTTKSCNDTVGFTNITDDKKLNNNLTTYNNDFDCKTEAEKKLNNDANDVKDDLKEHGVTVNVKHVKFSDIQNKSIVQLLNGNGYIKYGVYCGEVINDGEHFIKLFNGQDIVSVSFNKFKKDYTGVVLEFVSSNNEEIETECDVAQKIYDNKLSYLISKIDKHNNLLLAANALKCSGIAISILVMLFTIIASILMLAPEPLITKAAAITCYTIAIAVVLISFSIYVTGAVIESISTGYKIVYQAEKEDLENHTL